MTKECKLGQWSLILGDGTKFIGCKDYFGIGPADDPAIFWATAEDGHAQVFRASFGTNGKCRFDYFGGTFEIAFDLTGVEDFNIMSAEERQDWQKYTDAVGPNDPCNIIGQWDVSWIDSITQDQFERFLSDIKDPDLYACLMECVPPINPPSKPWSYGYEQPSRSVGIPIIPVQGDAGFAFITDWLEGKRSLPKAKVFEATWKLSEPVRNLKL